MSLRRYNRAAAPPTVNEGPANMILDLAASFAAFAADELGGDDYFEQWYPMAFDEYFELKTAEFLALLCAASAAGVSALN
jgi:hypothetical protein